MSEIINKSITGMKIDIRSLYYLTLLLILSVVNLEYIDGFQIYLEIVHKNQSRIFIIPNLMV